VVLPLAGMLAARSYVDRQRYGPAAVIASLVRFLHPMDGWWHQARLLRGQHLAEQGSVADALRVFDTLARTAGRGPTGRAAMAQAMRLRRQWPELLKWIELGLTPQTLQRELTLYLLYLRALGETGDFPRLALAFERHPRLMDQPPLAALRNMARLCLFAFGGDVPKLAALLYGGGLSGMTEPIKQFWLATAEQAAGETAAAEARLARIEAAGAAEHLRDAVADRRARPLPVVRPIGDARVDELLVRASADHRHELQYLRAAREHRRLPIATILLIAANAVMFIVEVRHGGSEKLRVLYRLGAAETFSVKYVHQWWRLLAANFLHLGWLHLTMNMLGLAVLGPFVERSLGRVLYLLVYLASGIGGVGVAVWFVKPGQPGSILVGASGAVMGIIGATGAILLVGWLRDKAHVARRRLANVLFVVVLQVVFDAMTPQVSGTAHLAGMAIGFVITLPLLALVRFAARTSNVERVA
jgi:rhomboid protease GluP